MVEGMPAGSSVDPAKLFPAPKVVTVAGRQVEIPAAGIRRCSEIVQRAMALAATEDGADELVIIDEHPDEANALITFALGCDPAWVATLDAVDKVDLCMAWMEVNGAFFVQRLLPARMRLRQMADLLGAGPTPSTTSSATDTPTPKATRRGRLHYGPLPSKEPVGANGSSA